MGLRGERVPRPVPAYEPGRTMWVPPEQAKKLGDSKA